MAQKTINIGTGELTGDGESIRSAFSKANDNFTELYSNTTNVETSVDLHLNTASATNNQILSWDGSDYVWRADNSGIALTDFVVGPEGGFSEEEKIFFKKNNFIGISCGNLTFRTETMPIVALSMAKALYGVKK